MLTALLLAAATPQTPQAFVAQLYAKYRNERFSPLDHIDAIFAPALAAAIRLDRRLAAGEEGVLDHDPICGCQDWTSLRPEIRHVTAVSSDRITVTIRLYDVNRYRSMHLKLERMKSGWRVADVMDHGSLLSLLDRENHKTAHH